MTVTVTKPPRRPGAPPTKPAAPSTRAPAPSEQLATDPLDRSRLALPPPGMVTSLRLLGRNEERVLIPTKRNFTLGSSPHPVVDLSVSSKTRPEDEEHVSKLHVTIQRKANRLWVVDQRSTNGTSKIGASKIGAGSDLGEEDDAFEIAAGEAFRVGDVTLLALDDRQRGLRPALQRALGFDAHARVDEALAMATSDAPLLLLGPRGCEQAALALQIHQASGRNQHAFVAIQPPLATLGEQTAVLAHASHGTAFLDLTVLDGPSAPFVAELFGRTYQTRPIIAAPNATTAAKRLVLVTDRLPRLSTIKLAPLRERPDDIPRLFDAHFRRAGSTRSLAELGTSNTAALCALPWTGNLEELERAAPRLLALVARDNDVAAAAAALDLTRQAFTKWLQRLGVRV